MADSNSKQVAEEVVAKEQKESNVLKYKNQILGGIVALIAVVAVYFGWKAYTDSRQAKASTEIAKAQEYFQLGITIDDADLLGKALNGDSINAGFLAIAEDYSSTKAGNLANLYAGLCFAHLDSLDKAAEYLNKYDAENDEMVSPAALGALGNVKASQGQLDEAVALLQKAADKADNSALSPMFLIQAGEILESQGKKDEALKLYEKVKADYPEWQQFNAYATGTNGIDNYIERAKQ